MLRSHHDHHDRKSDQERIAELERRWLAPSDWRGLGDVKEFREIQWELKKLRERLKRE
jgi:hypothetical protein